MRDSEAHWRRYAGTWKWRSEECNISIASKVENVADELKTKFCARYLGCPIGLIQGALAKACQLPVVQGDTEGSFIPFNKHFPKCWEPFCLNSLRWKYPHNSRELGKIKMTGTSQDDWLYAASGRQRQGRQRIGCLLGTRGVMWVLHLNQ